MKALNAKYSIQWSFQPSHVGQLPDIHWSFQSWFILQQPGLAPFHRSTLSRSACLHFSPGLEASYENPAAFLPWPQIPAAGSPKYHDWLNGDAEDSTADNRHICTTWATVWSSHKENAFGMLVGTSTTSRIHNAYRISKPLLESKKIALTYRQVNPPMLCATNIDSLVLYKKVSIEQPTSWSLNHHYLCYLPDWRATTRTFDRGRRRCFAMPWTIPIHDDSGLR